jgi:putative ABC transport system permease protein
VTAVGESAIVGLIASAAGVIAGIGLAMVLKAGLAALDIQLPSNGLVISPRTVLFGLVAGTLVTAVSAIVPARRGHDPAGRRPAGGGGRADSAVD